MTVDAKISVSSPYESGFVLPYVLVAIAVLSLSLILIGERLQNTSTLLRQIEVQLEHETALNSAESEAIYALLTAAPVAYGQDLNPAKSLTFSNSKNQQKPPQDIWLANGGIRQSLTSVGRVGVRYRDGSGFIPINNADRKTLIALTRSLGVRKQDGASLVAKLKDFVDEDSRRQNLGAESSDYRLRQMLPPTNGAIRTVGELNNIMDWESKLSQINERAILDKITFNPKIIFPKEHFIETKFREQLQFGVEKKRNLQAIHQLNKFPTDVARFEIYYQHPEGEFSMRSIEVEKMISSLHQPFSRQLIYQDATMDIHSDPRFSEIFSSISESSHVIFPPTYRYN